jgi:hypothetical protein
LDDGYIDDGAAKNGFELHDPLVPSMRAPANTPVKIKFKHQNQTNPLSFQPPPSTISSPQPNPKSSTPSSYALAPLNTLPLAELCSHNIASLPDYIDRELKTRHPKKKKIALFESYKPPTPTHETKGRGRPKLSTQLTDDFKVKVAMSVSKYRVPYGNVEGLARMWTGDENLLITTSTIHSILMEVYGRVFSYLFTNTILNSTNYIATIDGSSDLNSGKAPIAIQLRGEKDGTPWAYPVKFAETANHTAVTQLKLFQKLFEDITTLGTDKVCV